MSELSLFAPRSLKDIEDRLKRIAATECWCDVGDHEDALHDLAADDVPWLLAYVAEAERRGAERGWDEGRENLVRWIQDNRERVVQMLALGAEVKYERDASGPNPYRQTGADQ